MGAEATLKMLLIGEDRSASKALRGLGMTADAEGSRLGKFGKAVALSLVAAGGAALAFGKKSIDAFRDAASESMALSRTTGQTIADSSRMRFQAQMTGVSYESLTKSVKTFEKNLVASNSTQDKARQKTEAQNVKLAENIKLLEAVKKPTAAQVVHLTDMKNALDANNRALLTAAPGIGNLGIAMVDAHGKARSMTAIMADVADKFKKMPEGPAKTALAMKLFGKSGVDMIKMLNQGSKGLKDLAKESDRTGNTIKDTSALKAQIRAQREFHAAISGLMITLGAALMPILTTVAQFLAQHVAPAFANVTQFVREHKKLIADLTPVIAALVIGIGGLMILRKVTQAFAAFNLIIAANPVMAIVVAIVALVAGLILAYHKVGWFRDFVNASFKFIGDLVKTVVGFIKQHWQTMLAFLTGGISAAVIFIINHWNDITAFFTKAIGIVGGIFHSIATAIKTALSPVFGWIKGTLGAIIGIIQKVIQDIGNAATALSNVIGSPGSGGKTAYNNMKAHQAWVDGGKVGPEPPKFANGGIVMPRAGGTLVTVGEAGRAEAIIPLNRLGSMTGGGGPTTVNNFHIATLPGNEQATAREIKRLLAQQARLSGNSAAQAVFSGAW